MKHPMRELMDDVAAFHRMCGQPVAEEPAELSPDRIALRDSLMTEELKELRSAMATDNLEGIADGCADLIYVAIGTALEAGIPLDRVWAEVQRSNMDKADPETGEVVMRHDGKILKRNDWQPPNIRGAIYGGSSD